MCKTLQVTRTWMIALLLLGSIPLAAQAQNPTVGEVKAIKEESKASKLTPELIKVAESKSVVPAKNGRVSADGPEPLTLVIKDGTIAIEATATSRDGGEALLSALEGMGLREGKAYKSMVFGYLPIDKLREVSKLPELRFARPYYKPATNVGAVTSQGDAALRADVARTSYGVNGAGSKVGILSDSYDFLGGAAAGVTSGDLPAGVQVVDDLIDPDASDEGRAMAEIIHDVAPGAALAFNTAFKGVAGFAQGIRDLAAAGCNIIVDDIIYFAEPFFQDGLIAQAVDDVVINNQVSYFSSAGNQARSSYQAGFVNSGQNPFPGSGIPHDFGGGDIFQTITVPANRELLLSFQWDQSSFSASGLGPNSDLDIYLFDGNTLVWCISYR